MNNTSILKKIFPVPPNNNYNGLNYDDEGLYSITHPKEADIISSIIIEILGTNEISIVDLTAGCGGNVLSFVKHFNKVLGIEINTERYNILKGNLAKYSYNNYELICADATNNLINYKNYDVFFIDPPWGGPDYKKHSNLQLYLSNIKLNDFILMLPKNKLIVLKLPFNYNYGFINLYLIKKLIINNIIILFLKL
jgi:16S rRNA G966 N2-methylase RsmD